MKTVPGSLIDRLLTVSLIVAPVVLLLADTLYALRGWETDPTGAVVQVLGAITYTLVLLRLATWSNGAMAAILLIVGIFGVAGNVAYGFNTIHVSLGDTDLNDASGAATLIKPLGLCFPAMLLLGAIALRRISPLWTIGVLAAAAFAFPVAHIGNIAWLAVADNLALVVSLGAMAVTAPRAPARHVEPVVTKRLPA
jgi:hypothetical protein